MSLENISCNKSFGGWHKQYRHLSTVLNCEMRFAIYLPPQVNNGEKVPVLYWLSGLTCTDENFMQKAGAQRAAAELGIAIVAPDTSPRGEAVADDSSYSLGQGAGFYLNATEQPWQAHYQMYDYIVQELPSLIEATFPVTQQRSIAGHSMGGHGALVIALRNPDQYCAVSAFSPISNPMNCPWGQTAFSAYLGNNLEHWRAYDSCELIKQTAAQPKPIKLPIRIDQGEDDSFLHTELKPEALQAAAQQADYPVQFYRHQGYDHSYYFIASFIDLHLSFHASHLKKA